MTRKLQLKWEIVWAMILFVPTIFAQQTSDSLRFPIQNNYDPTGTNTQSFDLGDPSSVEQTIVYDPVTGTYVFKETIGKSGVNYRNPSMMTLEEYIEYERQKALRENWKDKIDEQTAENQPFEFPIKIKNKVFESIFGSDQITIRPAGSIELSFGASHSRYDNPILPVKQRKTTRFLFDQQINLNLVGQIGTRLKLGISYNTQASFDFDNQQKLEYVGDEDQILQKVALGNVSMDLPTTLIQGSQTLFGASTRLKFGHTTVDLLAASSKGQRKEINVTGGSQVQQFELSADNYEANRHFFVNQYFRDTYDQSMSTIPIPNTTLNITRIEVWVMNRINATENTRNIIAFTDLGEAQATNNEGNPGGYSGVLPQNSANAIYDWAMSQPLIRGFNNANTVLNSQVTAPGPFQQSQHYEKVENARKLNPSEYSYNAQLGYVSLNMPLNNDEVLAVAYEYTDRGITYQVGEFSTDGIDGQEALIVKLLKPTMTNPKNKIWDLMMKNVYSIGAYQVSQDAFRLNILYNNPETSVPVPFMPLPGVDDKQIVTLVDMDRVNINNQAFSDGVFDFVPIQFNGSRAENAGTINARNGRIYFSTVEPFGKTLADKLTDAGISPVTVNQIAYTELYDSTKTAAQQIPSKNRFTFKGEYESSISSDIPLNSLNVPEGAVSVTAGGIRLTEGVDFTVDYNLGRVKILNDAYLTSNTPIKVSVESNSVFGFQAKSMFGARVAHKFSDKFNIGATWMQMMERPITPKVDLGSEPFKNNVIGFDLAYETELPWLTKLVDLLPVISTKEKSTLSFSGEFAHLIPGTPRAISKEGIAYVDDFEGAQSSINLNSFSSWHLASIPKGQPDLFPEASNLGLPSGFKRSKLAWYVIDPLFFQGDNLTPNHIKNDPSQLSDSRVRLVNQTDIFPNLNLSYGSLPNLQSLDLAYYPTERGMYNYDTTNTVDANGHFTDPENRWGGIMRALTTTDFEKANVEYIQFWMLDPFNEFAENENPSSAHSGGDLYFNLGNVSEDVLPDGRRSFENGLPGLTATLSDPLDTTTWARVSTLQQTVNAFDTDANARILQDIGLDGWNSAEERAYYLSYVTWIQNNTTLSAAAKAAMLADPSNDDYSYYLSDIYDAQQLSILGRYKKYNGMEGNSPTLEQSAQQNSAGYPTSATNQPDREEINNNNTLDETEAYFQYKVSLRPNDMVVGKNFITSFQTYQNGTVTEKWYQFKIPISDFQKRVGGIQDFRTMRFMRMFLKDWNEQTVLRFARLEFIRGEWRKFTQDLTESGIGMPTDPDLTTFSIGTLNIEENNARTPIPYVVPPGIEREVDASQKQERQLNEQSLTMDVCGLQDGDARAAYKNVVFDIRNYKKLKMFAHMEDLDAANPTNDDDVTLFVRLGTDFKDNYYEYELPLKKTLAGQSVDVDVWPEANNVEIVFEHLLNLKKERNKLVESGVASYVAEYTKDDPENSSRLLKVKGNPNLQAVKTIMIGVRNPRKISNTKWSDDGLSKCVNVWVNELRLSDFEDKGGSAAVAQMRVQFADFAQVNMSGSYSGINWGALDSRVQERQRNEQMNFSMDATVQLGQFFGKKARVSLPFFYSYSLGIINPEYDPFNPDIKLKSYDREERKRRQKLGQDFTERKSYNFTNVRKELKAGAKNRFWRLSNWTLNYSYSETKMRDFDLNYDNTKVWSGGLAYSYSFNSKPWEPFKKVKFMKKSKWWKLIRDMNLYYLPKNITFSTDLMRSYNERQVRNNLVPDYEFQPVYVKNFTWNRNYGFDYDLTKKLKFSFKANNRSIFDEGDGRVDRKIDPAGYKVFRDTIKNQLNTLGKTMEYNHNYSFKYSLPWDKIPALDWVSTNITWKSSYNWQRAPLSQEEYGNIAQNSRDINVNAQLNFTSLYNKSKFFKKVNSGGRGGRSSGRKSLAGGKENIKPPKPETPDSLLTPRQLDRKKKKEERKKKREEAEKKRGGKVHPVLGFLGRMIMTVRSVSGTYSMTDGTLLPGYNQEARVLGFNPSFDGDMSGFIFGRQQRNVFGKSNGYNIAERIASRGWIVENEGLNKQYTTTHSQNINLKATLEPIKDLSIQISVNRVFGSNTTEFFRWNSTTAQFESQSRVVMSNVTYSNLSIGSAFAALGKRFSSSVFDKLLENRKEVSQLLGQANANSSQLTTGYYDGYGGSQQEVVLGAFLTSYTNRNVSKKNVNPIKNLPLPNWSVNYNGLKKFKFMKKIVKNFVLRHSYSSTISVSGMQTNLNAAFDGNGNATERDLNNNFISDLQIQNVAMTERFSPLIGFDATWNIKGQGLITKFEMNKDRSATLSLNNNQVTEVLGTEYIIGLGYKFKKVRLFKKLPPSPINIRFDFSLRDNVTVIRKVVENTAQATAGQKVISIKASVDYNVMKNLVVQLFYDQTINTPKIETSYPTGNLNAGLRLRFNLAGVN